MGMLLNTTRFGNIECDESSIITFTQPIIGFQEFRRFILLPGPKGDAITWLQSTDSGELAFLLVDPRRLLPEYEFTLTSTELSELAVDSEDELDVYTLLVIPNDRANIRTNLKAPILISPKHRLGKQTILEGTDYPVRFHLKDLTQTAPQEVSNARTDA